MQRNSIFIYLNGEISIEFLFPIRYKQTIGRKNLEANIVHHLITDFKDRLRKEIPYFELQ